MLKFITYYTQNYAQLAFTQVYTLCCSQPMAICDQTRFYKTDPNRTSGKIKLTPPVDSYTIVLVVLTLMISITQTTRGWFQQISFLGGV